MSAEGIRKLAWEIAGLVQAKAVLTRFRKQVQGWNMARRNRIAEKTVFDERREEHFRKTVANNPRFQEEESEPPKPDWKYEAFNNTPPPEGIVLACDTETHKKALWGIKEPPPGPWLLWGWVPPDLQWDAKPDTDLPSPRLERGLELDELYAILAAIHDFHVTGLEQIDPWHDSPPNTEWGVGLSYRILVSDVEKLHDGDLPPLDLYLENVRKDLQDAGLLVDGTGDATEGTSTSDCGEVPWDEHDYTFISSTEATKRFDGRLSYDKIRRLCERRALRYMRKGKRRRRVQVADLERVMAGIPGDEITDERIEAYLGGVEKEKAALHLRKVDQK